MDKYVLTTEQLVSLVRDFRADCFDGFISDDDAYVEQWVEDKNIPTELSSISKAWFEGFDKAKKTAFEALEQFKTK